MIRLQPASAPIPSAAPVRSRRRWLRRSLVVAFLLLGVGAHRLLSAGSEIIAGYTAKMLCSCVFVAGRDTERCRDEDLAEYTGLFRAEVDRAGQRVSSRALWLHTAHARHHRDRGCTLE